MVKEQNEKIGKISKALNFLLGSQLIDHPVNYKEFIVAECREGVGYQDRVYTQIISANPYKVESDAEITPIITNKEIGFEIGGSLKAGTPDIDFKALEVGLQLTLGVHFGVIDRVYNFFSRFSKGSIIGLPLQIGFIGPTIKFKGAKAELKRVDGAPYIERSGSIAASPLFGVEVEVDVYKFIQRHPVGAAVGKVLTNVYPIVRKANNIEQRLDNYFSNKKGFFKTAAYGYVKGKLTFGLESELISTPMNEQPLKISEVEAEFELGLHAGVRIEAEIQAFGGLLKVGGKIGAGISLTTTWKGNYNLDTQKGAIWHDGVKVKITVIAEGGIESNKNPEHVPRAKAKLQITETYEREWCKGGDKNPLLTFDCSSE